MPQPRLRFGFYTEKNASILTQSIEKNSSVLTEDQIFLIEKISEIFFSVLTEAPENASDHSRGPRFFSIEKNTSVHS